MPVVPKRARVLLSGLVQTIRQYRRRLKQAEELSEYAVREIIRTILIDEQDHLVAPAAALRIDAPQPGIAD